MNNVVMLREGIMPESKITTLLELAEERWKDGAIKGDHVKLDSTALRNIEDALIDLNNLGVLCARLPPSSLSEIERLGGIAPRVVIDKAMDGLIWLQMAVVMRRFEVEEAAGKPLV